MEKQDGVASQHSRNYGDEETEKQGLQESVTKQRRRQLNVKSLGSNRNGKEAAFMGRGKKVEHHSQPVQNKNNQPGGEMWQ